MNTPLAGIRILAVEQFGAGPFGTLFFADLGADVIKIEDPASGGDVARSVPPGVVGTSSLYFETFNRGKRSIAIDLKNQHGRVVFERLVKDADAVFNNLRGDQPVRLGLTYASLGRFDPKIVCVSLSAYGRNGPRAFEPGYDALVQAEAGWAAMTGEPGGPPIKSGLSMVDYAAGLTAAFGMLAGITSARSSGTGGDVDTSLYSTAISMLSYPATWALSAGVPSIRQPMSAHPSIVPFQFFKTADGYIAIACAKEKFFESLVRLAGLDSVATDPRFGNFSSRLIHRAELLAILEIRIAEERTSDWVGRLRGEVPCAPVRSMDEALDVDELKQRSMFVEYEQAELGTVRTVGSPLEFDGFEPVYKAGPEFGADRMAILTEHGYSPMQIDDLAAQGAFGAPAI